MAKVLTKPILGGFAWIVGGNVAKAAFDAIADHGGGPSSTVIDRQIYDRESNTTSASVTDIQNTHIERTSVTDQLIDRESIQSVNAASVGP